MIDKIQQFLREVRQEMAKVTWPSKEDLMGSTIVVIVISAILTVFIFFVDQILKIIMDRLL